MGDSNYSNLDWIQIFVFVVICVYPFFERNLNQSHHHLPQKKRYPVIRFISAVFVMGFLTGFLFILLCIELYQCFLDNPTPKLGLFDTARMISELITSKLPTPSSDEKLPFIRAMKTFTGTLAMCMYFLWSVSYYPGIFWKDVWFGKIAIYLQFAGILCICLYRAYP